MNRQWPIPSEVVPPWTVTMVMFHIAAWWCLIVRRLGFIAWLTKDLMFVECVYNIYIYKYGERERALQLTIVKWLCPPTDTSTWEFLKDTHLGSPAWPLGASEVPVYSFHTDQEIPSWVGEMDEGPGPEYYMSFPVAQLKQLKL